MTGGMTGVVLGALGVSTLVGVALTWCARWAGRRLLLLDSAGAAGHAKRLRAVPNVGGVAVFWTVAGPLAAVLVLAQAAPVWLSVVLPAAVAVHVGGVAEVAGVGWGLLGCMSALHVLGLVDDRRAVGAWWKLVLMALPCFALPGVFEGARLLTLLGPVASVALTGLWLLAVTNALNFMDNADGLAGTVGCAAAVAVMVHGLASGQWFIAGLCALVAGACLGFLRFNAPRSSIFMGDGGSLVLGFALGAVTVLASYARVDAVGEAGLGLGTMGSLLMPLAVLAVPMYDFGAVVVIRMSQGRSPMVGDQQHFSHRLRRRGLSDGAVVLVVGGLSVVCGVSGLMLVSGPVWLVPFVGAQVLVSVGVLALLEGATSAGRGEGGGGA